VGKKKASLSRALEGALSAAKRSGLIVTGCQIDTQSGLIKLQTGKPPLPDTVAGGNEWD
jgi:hypothetical protein